MKKRIVAVMLAVCMALGVSGQPIAVRAAQEEEVVQEYVYTLYNQKASIRAYNGNAETLVIPDTIDGYPVEEIMNKAFADCDTLVEVTIPEGVTRVETGAFDNCDNLKTVRVPASAGTVYGVWFTGCSSMEEVIVAEGNTTYMSKDGVLYSKDMSVMYYCPQTKTGNFTIPEGVVSTKNSIFNECVGLTSVTVPSTLTSFGGDAFKGCINLEEVIVEEENTAYASADGILLDKKQETVIKCPMGKTGDYTMPSTVKTVNSKAFMDSKLSNITFSANLDKIQTSAFSDCKNLTKVTLPNNLTSMGNYAFSGCEKLEEITLSKNLKAINYGAFENCSSLKEIFIPASVTEVAPDAFNGCDSLSTLTVDAKNKNYVAEDRALYDIDRTMLICLLKNYEGTYVVPDGVAEISEFAFYDCKKLTELVISSTVNVMYDIYGCDSLTAFQVDEDNKEYASLDGVLYSKDMKTLIRFPEGKGGSFTVPENVKTLKAGSFMNTKNLEILEIPETVTNVCQVDYGTGEKEYQTLFDSRSQDTILLITKGSDAEKYIKYFSGEGMGLEYRYCFGHEYESEILTEATCTTTGVQKNTCINETCGYVQTEEIIAKGHSYDKGVVTKEPTCTEEGIKTYTCTLEGCGNSYTESVAATGHTYNTGVITTQPTTTTTGVKTFTCTIAGCGHSYTETIPVSKEENKPTAVIKTVKLEKTTFTYDGKKKAPKVVVIDSNGKTLKEKTDYTLSYPKNTKSVGKYKVTVQFKGAYTGKKELTFTILPKGTSIKKVTGKKKGIAVSWNKQTKETTGYEVQYATSKKFTKKTTATADIKKNKTASKNFTKLKAKKTYYVRIRTYKTVKFEGKSVKLYSDWSTAKKVTTKK